MGKRERTAVYQFFGRDGRHLYIGITNSTEHRFAQHEADKWWWAHVHHSRTVVTWYPSRGKALAVEARMIGRHRPPGNKQHNPDWEGSPAGQAYRRSRTGRRRPRRVRARTDPRAYLAASAAAGLAALWAIWSGGAVPPGVVWSLVAACAILGIAANRRR